MCLKSLISITPALDAGCSSSSGEMGMLASSPVWKWELVAMVPSFSRGKKEMLSLQAVR